MQAKSEEEYERELKETKETYSSAHESLKILEGKYSETKDLLQKYYDLDVIFPKYRNLIAMCTIYEYFQTGRCSELTGPDGAYNLYESELRQNLIINKLDNITDHLDQIKNNQFVLYKALENINENIKAMYSYLDGIMVHTQQTAINSAVTAYCSEITAKNSILQTELLLY